MKHALKTGISFGVTSGVITTLGLMVGLHSGTHSKLVVIAGILTIAIADAFSDALGIHISEESENIHTEKQIWGATLATFLSKLIFALTFLIPVILFALSTAIIISMVWGLAVLAIFSYMMAVSQGRKPARVVAEHLVIACLVIIVTHFVGDWLSSSFR